MIASELYAQTLNTLTDARSSMLTPEWIEAQQQQSPETRLQASESLIRTQQAIAALSNAILSDIADDMVAQKDSLDEANADLEASLEQLTRVQAVLNSVATLINIVSRIVTLI